MQKNCEAALARVNGEIEGFEKRKEAEIREFESWKAKERDIINKEKEHI
jgi:hypothetical protein